MRRDIPETIGAYHIEAELAGGGLTRIYRVLGTDPAGVVRHYALKTLLHIDLADGESQERFHREVQLQIRLSHRNLCTCVDWGIWERSPYIVTELLEGQTLAARIHEAAPLSWDEVQPVVYSLLDVLEYLHAAGVVHREVTPANVFLTHPTGVKLLNFHLARATHGHTVTVTGTGLGHRSYSSPEQLTNAKYVDGRSDLYSLAVVTYEMLAGHLPYEGATRVECLDRQMRGVMSPLPPRANQPRGLERWLEQLLKPDRADRPRDVAAVRSSLQACLESEEI
ncbi:MAG: serine/threonine-protein kinase [Candidatus Xenobia bacterium]